MAAINARLMKIALAAFKCHLARIMHLNLHSNK